MIPLFLTLAMAAAEPSPTPFCTNPSAVAAWPTPLIRISYPFDCPEGPFAKAETGVIYASGLTVPGSKVWARLDPQGTTTEAQVYPNGVFVAPVTLLPGAQTLVCGAAEARGTTQTSRSIVVPDAPVTQDGVFVGTGSQPDTDQGLEGGEDFDVHFSGSVSCQGFFRIKGWAGWNPAPENPPGSGSYSGSLRLPRSLDLDPAPVDVELRSARGHRRQRLAGTLTVWRAELTPRVVRLTRDSALRSAPWGLAYGILPRGTLAEKTGFSGKFLRLALGNRGEAWLDSEAVEEMSPGTPAPRGWLSGVEAQPGSDSRREEVRLALGAVGPHWLRHDPHWGLLYLDIPGVKMDPYQVHKKAGCQLIESLDLGPLDEGEGLKLRVRLAAPLWGYRTRVEGGTLVLELKKGPPPSIRPFQGFRVLIDPGHGGEGKPWSVGASNAFGYAEKNANLAVSKHLRDLMVQAGAEVTLTREDDRDLRALRGFEAIRDLIRASDPDLYLAIHHNALPQATDPRTRQGRETFWLFPHQRPLAEALSWRAAPVTESAPGSDVFGRTYFFTEMTDPLSALVEVAYMSHPVEGALCQDPREQDLRAKEIFVALERFLKESRKAP